MWKNYSLTAGEGERFEKRGSSGGHDNYYTNEDNNETIRK